MDFQFQRGLLKTSMPCPGSFANMYLVACSTFKFPDLFIWRCSPCRNFENIRADQESSWSLWQVTDSCLQIANNCPADCVGLLGWCQKFIVVQVVPGKLTKLLLASYLEVMSVVKAEYSPTIEFTIDKSRTTQLNKYKETRRAK